MEKENSISVAWFRNIRIMMADGAKWIKNIHFQNNGPEKAEVHEKHETH